VRGNSYEFLVGRVICTMSTFTHEASEASVSVTAQVAPEAEVVLHSNVRFSQALEKLLHTLKKERPESASRLAQIFFPFASSSGSSRKNSRKKEEKKDEEKRRWTINLPSKVQSKIKSTLQRSSAPTALKSDVKSKEVNVQQDEKKDLAPEGWVLQWRTALEEFIIVYHEVFFEMERTYGRKDSDLMDLLNNQSSSDFRSGSVSRSSGDEDKDPIQPTEKAAPRQEIVDIAHTRLSHDRFILWGLVDALRIAFAEMNSEATNVQQKTLLDEVVAMILHSVAMVIKSHFLQFKLFSSSYLSILMECLRSNSQSILLGALEVVDMYLHFQGAEGSSSRFSGTAAPVSLRVKKVFKYEVAHKTAFFESGGFLLLYAISMKCTVPLESEELSWVPSYLNLSKFGEDKIGGVASIPFADCAHLCFTILAEVLSTGVWTTPPDAFLYLHSLSEHLASHLFQVIHCQSDRICKSAVLHLFLTKPQIIRVVCCWMRFSSNPKNLFYKNFRIGPSNQDYC
jgi:hypothetical protein